LKEAQSAEQRVEQKVVVTAGQLADKKVGLRVEKKADRSEYSWVQSKAGRWGRQRERLLGCWKALRRD
jgi:hypothetical protein